jgi:uncharacterized Zn finger protein
MAKNRKAPKRAKAACGICGGTMKLHRVIPAAHIFPELKTFQCCECGNLRTVEDVIELAIPDHISAAA